MRAWPLSAERRRKTNSETQTQTKKPESTGDPHRPFPGVLPLLSDFFIHSLFVLVFRRNETETDERGGGDAQDDGSGGSSGCLYGGSGGSSGTKDGGRGGSGGRIKKEAKSDLTLRRRSSLFGEESIRKESKLGGQ